MTSLPQPRPYPGFLFEEGVYKKKKLYKMDLKKSYMIFTSETHIFEGEGIKLDTHSPRIQPRQEKILQTNITTGSILHKKPHAGNFTLRIVQKYK